jgi:hypothetical protein
MQFMMRYYKMMNGNGMYYLNKYEYRVRSYDGENTCKLLLENCMDKNEQDEMYIDRRLPPMPVPFKKKD